MDSDAAAYCARSGAADRIAINAFVRGVKALGLWNSMVCWPLRSTQNAGTGTTAFSLGGLGTFNGTLVNGPTWGDNGIAFGAASHHIRTSLSFASASGNYTAIAAVRLASSTYLSNHAIVSSTTNVYPIYIEATSGPATAKTFYGGATKPAITASVEWSDAYRVVTAVKSGVTVTGYLNGANPTGGNPTISATDVANFEMGRSGASQLMTMPLAFYCTSALTAGEVSALYNLYRATLGTGLGLP
jgi:hypothetical protein